MPPRSWSELKTVAEETYVGFLRNPVVLSIFKRKIENKNSLKNKMPSVKYRLTQAFSKPIFLAT